MTTHTGEYASWLMASGLARSTVRQRELFAEKRLAEWGSLTTMTQAELADWLAGYTGWTRRTYHNHLKSIYAWLVETGQVDRNPLERIRQTKSPRLVAQPLTNDELDLVLGTARGDMRTWLLLGYLVGMRAHEIAKIRGEDVRRANVKIVGKGGVVDYVPTHEVIWNLAETFYPRRGYWFPSRQPGKDHVASSNIGNIIRAHFRALGIEDGAVHRLRHTYCTMLARNGVPTTVIQTLMRHGSLNTTQGYVAVSGEERAAAIGTLHVGPTVPHPGAQAGRVPNLGEGLLAASA